MENDPAVVSSLYCNEARLKTMSNFHKSVNKTGDSPFERTYDILSNRNKIDVIDVGCGTGSFWEKFSEFDFISSIMLCDQSYDLVERSFDVVKNKGISNIRKRVVDIELNMDLGGYEADVILVHQVYHHLQNPERVHASLINMLNKNGILVATTCNQDHMCEIYEQAAIFFEVDYEVARGLSHFNKKHMLKLSGFVDCENIEGSIYCDSVELLCNYISSLAILDRFSQGRGKTEAGFMEHMSLWGEKEIQDKGYIELKRSVLHAKFNVE